MESLIHCDLPVFSPFSAPAWGMALEAWLKSHNATFEVGNSVINILK